MVVTRKSLHKIVLNQIYEEMSYATATSPTQKLPYGTMQRILKQYTKDHPWLNRDKINFHYRKFKNDPLRCVLNLPAIDTTGGDISSEVAKEQEVGSKAGSNTSRFKGHPKGTTKASKFLLKDTLIAAKNEIAQMYLKQKHKLQIIGKGWKMDGSRCC